MGTPVPERVGLSDPSQPTAEDRKKPKKPGHGRNGADAYSGVQRVEVPHGQLTAGDHCPGFEKGWIYVQQDRNDGMAREQKMSPEERLRFHQQHSRPVMDKLHGWMQPQLDSRRTEPNSGPGMAIQSMLRHGKALTLFLRTARAPLDNNLCERSLK